MRYKRLQDKGAFTLIELMITVMIIVVLVSIVAPRYVRMVVTSRESTVASNLKSAAITCQLYANEHHCYPDEVSDLSGYLARDFIAAAGSEPPEAYYGYYYSYDLPEGTEGSFFFNADPQAGILSGARHFYIDPSLVIRATSEDRPATVEDPVI